MYSALEDERAKVSDYNELREKYREFRHYGRPDQDEIFELLDNFFNVIGGI